MLTREQKQEVIKDLSEKLNQNKLAVFCDFRGLKANQIQTLRKETKEAGIKYQVIKKTLLNLALKKAEIKDIDAKELQGEIAVGLSEDEISAAKILHRFSKKINALNLIGGILNKEFIDAKKVLMLANLPDEGELLGKLVGALNAPVLGFINILQGNIKSLIFVLNAISKSK